VGHADPGGTRVPGHVVVMWGRQGTAGQERPHPEIAGEALTAGKPPSQDQPEPPGPRPRSRALTRGGASRPAAGSPTFWCPRLRSANFARAVP
jgi:hypothetical protein